MKGRKKHAAGGMEHGSREWEQDLADRPQRYNQSNVEDEAEAKKRGGRAKRKRGGMVHHEKGAHLKHAKHVGMVHGESYEGHAGRKPRKAGGRTKGGKGSDMNPLSSAHAGQQPKAHQDVEID
jgi:hypothetical protein